MKNQILHPLVDFGVDTFGVLGIGAFNWDYIVKNLNAPFSGNSIKLPDGQGFRVLDETNKKLLEIYGPYTPDTVRAPGWDLIVDDKHKSGKNQTAASMLEFILEHDAIKRAGGGIINLGRAMVTHSSDIPMGITVLRGKGKIDDLVDGIVFDYIPVNGNADPGNIVFERVNSLPIKRAIVRGQAYIFNGAVRINPRLDFEVGTLVVNSIDSAQLTKAAIDYYNQRIEEGKPATGIFCITPKMEHSYDIISKGAVARGAITIFNPVDLIKYAFRKNTTHPTFDKPEKEIEYSDIFEAIKQIRLEQGNNPQRIYVTLGEYGCLGIGTGGRIYRTNVFDTVIKENNGAGDVFASMITRFEHRKGLNKRDYQPIFAIMAYASAASSIFCGGLAPTMGSIYSKLLREKSLEYEEIGDIDLMQTNCPKLKQTLSAVGNSPITRYTRMNFE